MSTHSLVITLCVLVLGCTARNLGKRTQKDEYIRLMREMTRYDVFHDECEFLPEERQECGKRTYDKEECQLRGCCYEICEGCDAEIPWCFLAKRMISDEQCQVAYEDKDDCGYYGITEAECVQVRDCCWAPSPLPNDPPCFGRIPELTVRLVDGTETADTLSGRVEINHEEQWGTVCDDNFDQNAADVVCRSLGYEYAVPKSYAEYGEGTGPIWLDGLRCRGDEERLEDCPHNGWGSHDCGHYEDAGVVCSNVEDYYSNYYYYYPYYYPYYYYGYYNYYDYYYPYYYDESGMYAYGDNSGSQDYSWYRLDGSQDGFIYRPLKTSAHHIGRRSTKDAHNNKLKNPFGKHMMKKALKNGKRTKAVDGQPRINKNIDMLPRHPKEHRFIPDINKNIDGQPRISKSSDILTGNMKVKGLDSRVDKTIDGQPRISKKSDGPPKHDAAAKASLHKRAPVTAQLRSAAKRAEKKKAAHKSRAQKMWNKRNLIQKLKSAKSAAQSLEAKAKQEDTNKH